jgi:plasmid stability protein
MAKELLRRVTIDLPAPCWKALKIRAAEDGVSMRTVVLAALREHLKKTGGRK